MERPSIEIPKQKSSIETFLSHDLPHQFTEQTASLRAAGLLEVIPASAEDDIAFETTEGITAMDGHQFELPTAEKITAHFSQEKYREKLEQGFTKLLIVPFGYPLETLKIRYTELLLQKHKERKLLAKDGTPLDLDTAKPLYFPEEFNHSDETGDLVYYPQQFDKANHDGKTKQELLTDPSQPFPGFHALLIKPDLTIPRIGKGKLQGTRADLEAGQSSEQYLDIIQKQPPYHQEQGFTLEDQLTLAITELETHNMVIDDFENNTDSYNRIIGNYHKSSGCVPLFGWVRAYRRADVRGDYLRGANEDGGARVAVG